MRNGAAANKPCVLYVDEAQQFAETALADMLSQVRKYNLWLVVLHQYLKQMQGKTLDALVGNVGTLIGFEVGDPDAGALRSYMAPGFERQMLTSLGKFRAAISMRVGDRREPAFSLETLPPPGYGAPDPERERYLRAKSVATYTPKPYSEVMDWINQTYGSSGLDYDEDTGDEFFE